MRSRPFAVHPPFGASRDAVVTRVEALHEVSLELARGSVTALVGESGSGKTLTAFSILGLLPAAARVESGEVSVTLTGEMDLLAWVPVTHRFRLRAR